MTSSVMKSFINYKKLNKTNKKDFIKFYIKTNTEDYNEYKNILKNKDLDERLIRFYNLRMKNHMAHVLLYNSILNNNKENIIKNFNDFNNQQLEFMEIMEEITEDQTVVSIFHSNVKGENKSGEQYRLICIEIKEHYDLLKYIIEDYNNIKL